MRPSRDLIIAIKLADRPAWKIAHQAHVNPSVLSRLISGSLRTRSNDERLLRVAAVLGVPADRVFEPAEAAVVGSEAG